ncbi:MAG: LysR substrate-binding domain-containing protein, partial [Gemmobacter sp.]
YHGELISADCFCALPRNHPLTRGRSISIRDLDGLPMGILQSNHMLQQRLQESFDRLGARLRKRVDSQTFLPLLQFVAAGRCVAVVDPLTVISESSINITRDQVVFRPLSEPLRYDYMIIFPRHRPLSQLARMVMNAWREKLSELLNSISANPHVQAISTDEASHEVDSTAKRQAG